MLSFAYPWFLLGLAGLAVPVALHLMNRERAIPQPFPSIRFIAASRVPREGRRQLRDILLLLVRLLLLAAAVVALARPTWRPPTVAALAADGSPREIVLVIDLSASMDGWGGFGSARTAATKLVATYPTARAGLVTFPGQARVVLPSTADRTQLTTALAALKPSSFRGDPGPALHEALRLFSGSGPRLVAIVSDFQNSDWQDASLPALPPETRIEFIPVNPRRQGNAGILTVKSTMLADGSARLTAIVRNFGADTVQRELQVQCGKQSLVRPIALPPRQNREISLILPHPASAQAEVRLSHDAYTGDDSYVAAIGRRPPIRLLAVVPLSAEPAKQQEFFFVRKALESKTDGDAKPFAVESVEPEFFPTLQLEEFPVVFLLGAGGYFQEAEWQLCHRYVEEGGWLISTPGARALEQFQAVRRYGLANDEFTGVKRFDTAAQGMPFNVAWVNPEGPLAPYAAESYDSELFLFSIGRYAQLRPAADSRILLRASTDDPLLTERVLGKGRILQFAYGFDLTWSEMPMTTAFLPILRELVTSAVPADYGTVRVDCGGVLPEPLARQFRETRRNVRRASLPDLTQIGIQRVGQTPIEVNISRQESIVEQVDLAALRLRVAGAPAEQRLPAATSAGTGSRAYNLWPTLATAAVLLFLLEIVLTTVLDRRGMPRSVTRAGTAPPSVEESTTP